MILMLLKDSKILYIDGNILTVNFKNKTKCFPIMEKIFREGVFAPGYKSLKTHIHLTNA